MNSRIVCGYQLLTGLSDTSTGALLIFAPAFTLRLMELHVPDAALPFLSYIGAFVLSVGLACLYGAALAVRPASSARLEMVWLLTALTRGVVAVFVLSSILSGRLEMGWITVAITDGLFALVQTIGLLRGWLRDA